MAIRSGKTAPSTARSTSSVFRPSLRESLKWVLPRRTSLTPMARSRAIWAALIRFAFCDRKQFKTPLSAALRIIAASVSPKSP